MFATALGVVLRSVEQAFPDVPAGEAPEASVESWVDLTVLTVFVYACYALRASVHPRNIYLLQCSATTAVLLIYSSDGAIAEYIFYRISMVLYGVIIVLVIELCVFPASTRTLLEAEVRGFPCLAASCVGAAAQLAEGGTPLADVGTAGAWADAKAEAGRTLAAACAAAAAASAKATELLPTASLELSVGIRPPFREAAYSTLVGLGTGISRDLIQLGESLTKLDYDSGAASGSCADTAASEESTGGAGSRVDARGRAAVVRQMLRLLHQRAEGMCRAMEALDAAKGSASARKEAADPRADPGEEEAMEGRLLLESFSALRVFDHLHAELLRLWKAYFDRRRALFDASQQEREGGADALHVAQQPELLSVASAVSAVLGLCKELQQLGDQWGGLYATSPQLLPRHRTLAARQRRTGQPNPRARP